MFKISNIISMPVISIYEGEFQGIIYNIMFDFKNKKCKYLCILNEEEGIQKVLKLSDIYLVGDECIFIKNNSVLELECIYNMDMINSTPLNSKCYNMNGKMIGTSIDILLDKKFNLQSIILNNGESINSNQIVNMSNSIILSNQSPINISKFKPKQKTYIDNIAENKVVLLSPTKKTNIIQEKTNNTQNKIITDFGFLIGRKLNKDITAINGEIIAKNGNTITKEIVHKASFYGKLAEITRYSKKD